MVVGAYVIEYFSPPGLVIDTIVAGVGTVQGLKLVAVVHEFNFMGGSLGIAAGEAIVKAFERAIKEKCPLVMFPASGGARMQEGILSLMQLPRTTVVVDMLKEAGQPYIVVLTNPTTGGVTASYAMLGDVHISEPGALIGFAGQRVIEQTIREKLLYYPAVSREAFPNHGRLTDLMASGAMMQTLGIEPLDAERDRAMICGSPQMLADFRALLDSRGFTAAPRIGTPGQYVFERAFVEK